MRAARWLIDYLRLSLRAALLCAGLAGAAASAAGADTTVFAAASLRNALDEVAQRYQFGRGGRVVISYAGTSALARQIENGAPADIFMAADTDWMDYVEKRSLLRHGTRVNLLRNEIVLIAPAGSDWSLAIQPGFALAAALGNGRLAMADPDHVPAGKYGKAALQSLGVWNAVAGRLARAENVRVALNFVARGEAPAGIVYRTDAAAEGRVRIVGTFAADTHPPIVYPAAQLARADSAQVRQFFGFLQSVDAAEIFRKHGFLTY